jgi:Skp family chaperone for outer membrane proteins
MKRLTLVVAVITLALSGSAFARASKSQTPPPAKPPQQQTPPPQTPPAKPPQQQTPPPLLPPAPSTPAARPAPLTPAVLPPDAKFAFFSFQALIQDSDLGKAGQVKMKSRADALNAVITGKQKMAQQLQQEIQTQQSVWTAAVLANKTAELEKAGRDIQNDLQNQNTELQNLQQQLVDEFQDKVLPIVEALAKEKKLQAVFSVDNSGAAYVDPNLDLTAEIVKRLNAIK